MTTIKAKKININIQLWLQDFLSWALSLKYFTCNETRSPLNAATCKGVSEREPEPSLSSFCVENARSRIRSEIS